MLAPTMIEGKAIGRKASTSNIHPYRGTARCAIHASRKVRPTISVAAIAPSDTLVTTASAKIG